MTERSREHPSVGGDGDTVNDMTMKVELGELAERLGEYSFAYLVTVGDDGLVHLLAVLPELGGEALTIGGVGKHSLANVATHPTATLVGHPPVRTASASSSMARPTGAMTASSSSGRRRRSSTGPPSTPPASAPARLRPGVIAPPGAIGVFAARLCRPVAVPLAANTPMEITWGSWTSGLSFRRGGR